VGPSTEGATATSEVAIVVEAEEEKAVSVMITVSAVSLLCDDRCSVSTITLWDGGASDVDAITWWDGGASEVITCWMEELC